MMRHRRGRRRPRHADRQGGAESDSECFQTAAIWHKRTPSGGPINPNGCHYRLTGETTAGNVTGGEHATMHLDCPEGKSMEITVTALKLKCLAIPPQTLLGVRYENGPEDIKVQVTAHGLHSTTKGPCIMEGKETLSEGVYEAEFTLRGSKGEKLSISTT